MFVRRIAIVLTLLIGALSAMLDASTSLASHGVKHQGVLYRPPIMSRAQGLKEDDMCRHAPASTPVLLPHSVADSAPCRVTAPSLPQQVTAVIHPQTDVSHAPELPASNRIRAPSV